MANLSNINNKFLVTTGGNVLIGKTAANNATVGNQFMTDGSANSTVNGDTVARFNRLTSNGEIIRLQKDTSTVGSIGSTTSYLLGDLGIGTTSPVDRLTLYEGTNNNVGIYFQTATSGTTGADGFRVGQNAFNAFCWNYEATPLTFATSGIERMRIASGGNVGINETDPSSISSGATTLHIKGTVTSKAGGIRLRSSDNSVDAYIYPDSTNGMTNGTLSNHPYRIVTNGSERMRIDSSGNALIGIDTISATLSSFAQLEVSDSTKGGIIINTQTADASNYSRLMFSINNNINGHEGLIRYNTSDYHMAFWTDSSERMRITSTGAVGIGMTSPNRPLDVLSASSSSSGIQQWSYNSAPSSYRLQLNTVVTSGVVRYSFDMLNAGATYDNVLVLDRGNVGIGTSSPSEILHLNAPGTGCFIRFQNTGGSGVYIGGRSEVMEMYTNGSEKMRITSTGNVGIGTSSPRPVGSGYTALEVSNPSSGSSIWLSGFTDSTKGYLAMDTGGLNLTAISNHPLTFGTNNAPRMRIDSSGDVGIGVTDGDIFGRFYGRSVGIGGTGIAKLQINGTSYSGIDLGQNGTRYGELNASATIVQLQTLADIPLTFGTGTGATERMRIHSNGRVSIGSTTASANTLTLSGIATEMDMTNTSTNGRSYRLESDSAGLFVIKDRTANVDRIVLDSSGNVDISDATIGNAGTRIWGGSDGGIIYMYRPINQGTQVMRFYVGSTSVGYIGTSNSGAAFTSNSDYRLKENVVELTGALDRISELKPSRFNFIVEPNKTVDGFLAHEVQDIVPEAVFGEKDAVDEEGNPDYQTMEQSKLVPLLVAAIQELKADNDSLKARIETLENN